MNPHILIEQANGGIVRIELDKAWVYQDFTPRKLLDFMQALQRDNVFGGTTFLEMLPLSHTLQQEWMQASPDASPLSRMHPSINWRFGDRIEETMQEDGPPLFTVHAFIDTDALSNTVENFFGSCLVVRSISTQ